LIDKKEQKHISSRILQFEIKNHFYYLLKIKMVVEANAAEVLTVGLACIGFGPERTLGHSDKTQLKHFESAFGIDPDTISTIFHEIQVRDIGDKQIRKPKLPHFLLALHWLKRYPIEQMSSGIFGYHEDTVRKWVWTYCSAIQALKPYKVREIKLNCFLFCCHLY
jgi:hypothetical protein